MRPTIFVDVIVPLALPKPFTYRVPLEQNESIEIGRRVVVQFGKKKLYTALIRNIHTSPPKEYEAKYIEQVIDDAPVVTPRQFAFWEWMATYYMCTIGEVMAAALPGAFRLNSETRILLNPDFDGNLEALDDKEFLLAEALEIRKVLTLTEVEQILQVKSIHTVIRRMLDKGVLFLEEELKEKYKPKIESYVQLSEEADKEENLKIIFDSLAKSPRQEELLIAYIHLTGRYQNKLSEIRKTELLKYDTATSSALSALIKKGILVEIKKERGRLNFDDSKLFPVNELNEMQLSAMQEIKEAYKTKDVVLLQGVTSSGKTELYIHLINEQIKQGKQVLYLLPEIALTTQIINRLKKHFGNRVGVYHSRFNEHERVEIWKSILNKETRKYDIILGARSALFMPFNNLGLIIVDEEHDTSYKQYDPAPRYHARDSSGYLASLHGAKVLLGTATPSLESWQNATTGKFGWVKMLKRFGGMEMPQLVIADIKKEMKEKTMKSHFSSLLISEIEKAISNKEQIILFQNRRGYSAYIECQTCNNIPQCVSCDVSLTYHKQSGLMRCHYCGYSTNVPTICVACGDHHLKMVGFGTEKIEDELSIFFPDVRIARMDLDTTRAKHAHQTLINNFEDKEIDVLVGTQMVTKGLDFANVSLVGILNADQLLFYPDFRSNERSFQLLQQVSGRAGRKNKQGKVVIQTSHPQHPVIQHLLGSTQTEFYQSELVQRQMFNYPPFSRLIEITIKHKKKEVLDKASIILGNDLRHVFGARMLGPQYPDISRIQDYHIQRILLKIEKDISISQSKKLITESILKVKQSEGLKNIIIQANADAL